MEEKKYIDRLYQEKFKDFEAAPRKDLWNDIAAELKNKERKRFVLLPLWTRIAGVAAILLFVLMVGDWFNLQSKPSVVSNEDTILKKEPTAQSELASVEDKVEKQAEVGNIVEKKKTEFSRSRNSHQGISSLSEMNLIESVLELPVSLNLKGKGSENNNLPEEQISIVDAIEENSLKESIVVTSIPNRLEISTHAAPVYFGNLKSGNFLDSRFNSKNSQGELTYSYGINIAYKLNDKLKVRSGLNKVNLSHITHNIALQAVINPRAITSISYRGDLGIRMVNGVISLKGNSGTGTNTLRSMLDHSSRGNLNQSLGFIEVPLELEYVLLDKQFGINLIGGASTLFLDENTISVSSGNLATVLGEANNLNEISFSTNIGLGFNYKISDKFLFNLEPMFKYQINTYDVASGTYRPYYIGIYSGFSYKF